MEIEISQDILNDVKIASKELNLNEKEIIARAVKLYLQSIKDQIDLNEEISLWEEAGIEDSINFNKINNL